MALSVFGVVVALLVPLAECAPALGALAGQRRVFAQDEADDRQG
jgi:hypothetical protein